MYLVSSSLMCAMMLLRAMGSFAQRGASFTISKEIVIKDADKEKAFKKGKNWIKGLDNVTISRWNDDQCVLEATSSLPYENDVVLEDVLLSPNAALRTKGVINFTIKLSSESGKCKVEFTDFNHEAAYNRYGKISFGLILTNEKVPLDKCFENTAWCNAVWEDMKTKIRRHCLQIMEEAKRKFD
mgnify:CR=1 FL=1